MFALSALDLRRLNNVNAIMTKYNMCITPFVIAIAILLLDVSTSTWNCPCFYSTRWTLGGYDEAIQSKMA